VQQQAGRRPAQAVVFHPFVLAILYRNWLAYYSTRILQLGIFKFEDHKRPTQAAVFMP
jgi:hypothetical protein